MWVRKRIDILPRDLLFGIRACCKWQDRKQLESQIESCWKQDQTFVCLSVRSGFDLLLSRIKLPPGSEILMSGMTIPHMPEIVRENNFVPVPVDLDARTLSISADQIRAKITPRTKAIVVAHLFGGLCDLRPVIEVAREHKLLVIEDCAQAYAGSHYQGDDRADVSMFSFGAIKTNTSLCGGVFIVRRDSLLKRLKNAHRRWPVQTRWTMFKRLIKYCLVKTISTFYISKIISSGLRWIGRDHDGLAVKLSRGFSGGDFFARIRQQPSTALLALMHRRLSKFDDREILQRTKRGHKLEKALRSSVQVLGREMDRQTCWVFPVLVEDRDQLVRYLWKLGFDATTHCSMQAADQLNKPSVAGAKPGDSGRESKSQLHNVRFMLDHIVFLPFDMSISPQELKRMAQAILAFEPGRVALPSAPQPQPQPQPQASSLLLARKTSEIQN